MTEQLEPMEGLLDQVDLNTFRSVMGSLPTGVSVVTSITAEGEPRGLTCSAVCSVSASPPLLLVCVKHPSATLEAIHESSVFAVNFLSSGMADVAKTFASPVPERFEGVPWTQGKRIAAPVLHATVATAECILTSSYLAGDHQILVGRLVHGDVSTVHTPLAYWRARFSELTAATPAA
ncbi:flavin reductase family protein [Streptomyces cylindrosporus]|uniref:Flavin reductase family protein n=1 Tax=Streptomyces cylindrosporus TaxID=2927583 RepID=A0ABS9Y258_9ACTN|nr:flavin reductase family protein [Streptomyces cylindrosporus]MCI3271294.1 flavin reductase family protein [Streptomyces cylindrosporus]